MSGATISPDGIVDTSSEASRASRSSLYRSSCASRSAIVVRCTRQRSPQPDCLGEQAREELAQVPVVRRGQARRTVGTARSSPGCRRAGPAFVHSSLVARAAGPCRCPSGIANGSRSARAVGRAVDQRAQPVEPVVGVTDLELGHDREVVHAHDRRLEVEEALAEPHREVEAADRHLVAQARRSSPRSRASSRARAASSGW